MTGKHGTVERRFWDKVHPCPNTGCWLWGGAIITSGYGHIGVPKSEFPCGTKRAHRVSYEIHKGKIPENTVLDHLCRVRHCVNPDHLEAVPHRENIRRGFGHAADKMRRTECRKGHPYDTVRVYEDGPHRSCSTCDRENSLARYYRNKAKASLVCS